ncbi:MAG: MATE family efflux transporter [Bradyrhizobium sp.]|uniref:MATE family efflux transporter n=1 Tax=Bradyrhizobium sp. TaxID=376 RepID=UPI001C2A0705|nr:MATE family efflux transporter [Bradyrhizobium sp.]MBU6463139.1 MATE family efflux transporter [Pseudomonadota bacterium]MDE2068716.1 MATE family efflux transporter [Bradyrhizobium sp.]MDE2243287.1 MATE family efflux transporter [Bradyrhizobium sp.]MDE2469632.1 MATE family efflux transporter [Bradyrhizobium sp.]
MRTTAGTISNAVVPRDESALWRAMLQFLVPQTLGVALQLISNTVTIAYLGRLIGAPALAAASTFFPIFFLLTSFLLGLFSGGVVLVGQAHGAGDTAGVRAVVGTTLCIGGTLSVGVAAAGYATAADILVLIGSPPDILVMATGYSQATFIALPLLVILFAYLVLLRGTGDALTPLWAMILWIALGFVLTPALIQGWFGLPRMGVRSAPYGNLAASGVTLAALLLWLKRCGHPFAPDRAFVAALRFDATIAVRLLGIGIPAGVQVALVALSEVVVVSLVNTFGSDATAAYGIFNQVISYVQAPARAAAVAASVFGAQAIGARQSDRLGAVARIGVLLAIMAGALVIGAVYLFSGNILSVFTGVPGPRSIAHHALVVTLWSHLLVGVAGVLAGVMRSSGDVLVPTAVSVAAIWAIQLPAAYVLSRRLGLDGVWVGYAVAFVVTLVAQAAYYLLIWRYRTHWQLV